MEDKIRDHRQEKINLRKPSSFDKTTNNMLTAYWKAQKAGKIKVKKEAQSTGGGGSPAKKQIGQSKKGLTTKKEREISMDE